MRRARRQGNALRNWSRSVEARLAPVAVAAWTGGCNPSSTACVDTGMCVADAATFDASATDARVPPDARAPFDSGTFEAGTFDSAPEAAVCDPTKDPKDDPCVLANAYGVFVAPAGGSSDAGAPDDDAADAVAPDADADSGDGSMARPFASLGDALAHRNGTDRIYVCNGTYAESVTVTSPVTIYGGLSCTGGTWRWVGGVALVTAPPSSNAAPSFALTVSGTAGPVTLQDMGFVASDAAGLDSGGNGASSVAALIQNSTVTLTRCLLRAGKGARGIDGVTQPSNYSPAGPAPSGGVGDNPGAITCQSKSDGVNLDSSTGGTGGLVAGSGAGGDGTAQPEPAFTVGVTPAGHDGKGSAWPGAGDPGQDGAGQPGGSSATAAGTLSTGGWVPSRGADGSPGLPGQGGGGGPLSAGQYPQDGSAGGAGGCGGAAGTGGTGGGASIALVSIASTVALQACTLVTDRGGDGGNGGAGQGGQTGGAGGPVTTAGTGGNGAGGSGGAGGSAGISVGIVYSPGSVPAYDPNDTSIAHGAAGMGGSGGQPGLGPGATVPAVGMGAAGYVDPNAAGAALLAPLLP